MTTIDLSTHRKTTVVAGLPRKAFYFSGDDILYHASTGEWARVVEGEDGDEEPIACGLMLCMPPRKLDAPYDFEAAIKILAAADRSADVSAEKRMHARLHLLADEFEGAPSGHFACVLGSSTWGLVLAVGETPERASENALAAEEESAPANDVGDVAVRHRDFVARGAIHCRPITRRALVEFQENGDAMRFAITDDGRVDLAKVDEWKPN